MRYAVWSLLLCACGSTDGESSLEPGETFPGGDTTNQILLGDRAFTMPAANVEGADRAAFFSGNAFFNEVWVQAPASTGARDGLGPTFNASSCSGCHFKDGRGHPDEGDQTHGLLIRLSVAGEGSHGEAPADAAYGGQFQPYAVGDVPAEGRLVIEYAERESEYDDGEGYSLLYPTYRLEDGAFGDFPAALLMSPRVAPQVIGLGLLEAIPEAELRRLADPDDADGDGISGKLNDVWDVTAEEMAVGRFGWKAEQPTVRQQVAGAFLGDMGITSSLFPDENCPEPQTDCAASPSGGEDGQPELEDNLLDRVAYYSRLLAPPVREGAGDAEVLRGKRIFSDVGCADCHVPSFTTGDFEISQLEEQRIWPYTDLLLHDMGPDLSDERPSFAAEGEEWRTPPLWGVGRFESVNGHSRLLHDGRARGVAEAVLWHGGEAKQSRDAFRALSAPERDALVRFVESL